MSPPNAPPLTTSRLQQTPAAFYVILCLATLGIFLLVGWYLLKNPVLLSNQAFFVLLILLGLSAAAFLFGALRSTARLTGQQFGYEIELGGPVVIAVLVVAGGFYVAKQPDDFYFVVQLRNGESQVIPDVADSTIRVDFSANHELHRFSDGQAIFLHVPMNFRNAEVPIEFNSPRYSLKEPKKAKMILDNGLVYLDVVEVKPNVVEVNPTPEKPKADDGGVFSRLRRLFGLHAD
jgi:hypothetical protein